MRFIILSICLGVTGMQNIYGVSWWDMTPLEVRERINQRIMDIEAPIPSVWCIENRIIKTDARATPVRIYLPNQKEDLPVILLIHGGAWVAGNLDTHDNLARYLCSQVEAVVVSVGYMNAPEGKFPLQLNQCLDALTWIISNANEFSVNPSRLAVVGDSAGGNIAAALCLKVGDLQGPKIDLQVLINPALDLRCNGTIERQNDCIDLLRWQANQYLSNSDEANNPYVSPLNASDLSNLPTTLILLAENDELRLDGECFADRLKESGVSTFVYLQKGTGHLAGHGARASSQARESLDVAVAALKNAFVKHKEGIKLVPMVTKQPFSDKHIIECLNAYYGIEVTALTPLLLGADMDASVYKAQGHDQKSYFVKLKSGREHDNDIAILAFLHDEGIQQIIPPLKTSQGQLTQQIDEFTLIVYPFIEGQDGFSQILTDDQWVILGKVLRKVHELKVPIEILDRIKRETYSSKWRDIVRSLYGHIEAEPRGDEVAKKLLKFMKEHKEDIYRLVDTAEHLSKKIGQRSDEFVLCHADIHGGNVLIGANGSLYIVDWDEPIMAPKERDLMFIGGGVANVWNNPREEEFFYKGYGKAEINMSILAYYRHERIVVDIAEYAQGLLLTKDGDNRVEMYNQFVDMFEPRGVVDIAFKTAEYVAE